MRGLEMDTVRHARDPSKQDGSEQDPLLDETPLLILSETESEPAKPAINTDNLFRKLSWRLLPLFWFMVVLNYVDRTNLAFAAIELNQDLNFTPDVYGLGSGLFFATYATLQIPSNIILRRVGGPAWLAGIIAAWGSCAMAFTLMRNKTHFYVLRTLLGVAEAGAFPGMWYILNRFYPPSRITLAFAVVESGIALSHTLAAPLAAGLLTLDGTWGLRGWQWLFLLEGLPSVVLAIAMALLLPPRPEQASVLTPDERAYLVAKMKAVHDSKDNADKSKRSFDGSSEQRALLLDRAEAGSPDVPVIIRAVPSKQDLVATKETGLETRASNSASVKSAAVNRSAMATACDGVISQLEKLFPPDVWSALVKACSNKYVWYLGICKGLKDIAGYGILFFTPQIVNALLHGTALGPAHEEEEENENTSHHLLRHLLGDAPPRDVKEIGVKAALLTSVPFGMAAAVMMCIAHMSQKDGERILYMTIPLMTGGIIFAFFPWLAKLSAVAAFAALCCLVMGVNAGSAPNLALLSELAAGPGLVVALPLYNSIGNLGGFLGPYLIGELLKATNSFAVPSVMMGLCVAASGAGMLCMPKLLGMPDRVGRSKPKQRL